MIAAIKHRWVVGNARVIFPPALARRRIRRRFYDDDHLVFAVAPLLSFTVSSKYTDRDVNLIRWVAVFTFFMLLPKRIYFHPCVRYNCSIRSYDFVPQFYTAQWRVTVWSTLASAIGNSFEPSLTVSFHLGLCGSSAIIVTVSSNVYWPAINPDQSALQYSLVIVTADAPSILTHE